MSNPCPLGPMISGMQPHDFREGLGNTAAPVMYCGQCGEVRPLRPAQQTAGTTTPATQKQPSWRP